MSKQSVVCIRSNMSSYWEFLTKRPDLSSICWKKAVADPAGLSDNYWGTYSFVCIYKKIKLIKDCALKVARESIRLIIDDVDTISTGRVKEWEDWFSSLGHGSYAKAAAALTKTSTRLRRSAYIVSGVLFVFSSVCNIFELLLKYTYSS